MCGRSALGPHGIQVKSGRCCLRREGVPKRDRPDAEAGQECRRHRVAPHIALAVALPCVRRAWKYFPPSQEKCKS